MFLECYHAGVPKSGNKSAAQPSPRDRARAARLGVYREHVVAAAERVFAEHGFEAAKLQDISKLAGLSMGTIYAVFPGKSELLQAILESRGREMLGLVQDVVAAGGAPDATLQRLSEAYIDYFVEHPAFLQLHLREGRAWIQSPTTGTDRRSEIWQGIHALQASIFRKGIEQGVFIDDDPSFLAKAFSALDQVVLADWVAGGMKRSRVDLIERLQGLVNRTFSLQGR